MTRKQYSSELKHQIIKEALETGNASIVARRHDISTNLVSKWVRQYKRGELVFLREKNSYHSGIEFFSPTDCYQLLKENRLELKPVRV